MRNKGMKIAAWWVVLLLLCVSACTQKGEKATVVSVTIRPLEYFVNQIAGDEVQVHCIVPNGSSPETFDPSPQQMAQLARSKAYFMVGYLGFEQAWGAKISENNSALTMVNLSKGLTLLHGGHACSNHHHHEENRAGIDPHTWSSPAMVRTIVRSICDELTVLLPEKRDLFEENLSHLLAEVQQTDDSIRTLLKASGSKSFLIYHPSLAYFAQEYGLHQISIESEGKEPTPEQLKELIKRVREEKIEVIFVQQEFDVRNAQLVAQSTGCKVVTINPLTYEWSEELIKIASVINDSYGTVGE